MDYKIIEDQLGNFSSFVEAMNNLLDQFPKALFYVAGLFGGDIKPFESHTYQYENSVAKAGVKMGVAYAKKLN